MNEIIKQLFTDLHENPESSEREEKTRKIITEFMNRNTSMEYYELPGGFYYVYRSPKGLKNIAIRADYDAVTCDDHKARHLCGHDGHATSLCALALLLEEKGCDNNVFLLFQSAEENGEGAKKCLDIFNEKIDVIYGQHNLPGFAFGKVFTSYDTFACTSCGLIIRLKGRSSHAAYPELGISPGHLSAEILKKIEGYHTLEKMITLIGVKIGEKTFGVMAHEAEIYLTLRSTTDENLKELEEELISYIDMNKGELKFSYEKIDHFPAVFNDKEEAQRVLDRLDGELLKEPMRWSEDFAHYLKGHKGAFFGIGAGEKHPGLHTAEYVYPVELIDITRDCFYGLVK